MKRKWYVNLAEETDSELINDFCRWYESKSSSPVMNSKMGCYGCNGKFYEPFIAIEIRNLNISKISLIDWLKIRNEI